MKNWIKAVLIFVIFCVTILFPKIIEARSGCCSHHGGVCGCGCCDGTGLSATCAPYYPKCNGDMDNVVIIRPTSTRKPTSVPKSTSTPKPTKVPTARPTKKPTPTKKPNPTATMTPTNTPTPTLIPTSISTITVTSTPTEAEITPTVQPTVTSKVTPIPTSTHVLTFWQKILRLFNKK